ncbi:zinc metalloprotease [Nocardiopsis sp. CNT312]|uniref:zinc metalloprotease n=1 Tax=Nocardiopsis sp. CNT312 TaxID=1137268 RepID=UPI0018CC0B7A|nr:zinc metalloprotease [Nocardiopsis sp. CNT312]
MARCSGGGSAALWSGLVLCGVALAGTVAMAPGNGSGTADPGERHEECDPAAAARVADPAAASRLPVGSELTPHQAAEYERRLQDALSSMHGQRSAVADSREVPVVVHVVSASDGRGRVSDHRIRQQIHVLNQAYGGGFADQGVDTGFRFSLREITRTVDDTWFGDFTAHRDEIRADLHRGGAETLNLYTTDLAGDLLGYSTFPQDQQDRPEQDGVVISYRSLPGGSLRGFDLGHTATHEIGHWLGLFHTFQNGCARPGDYVDDTPYEREAAAGCPRGRDSCRERRGADPVTNFMNYSHDGCMTHFTQGQADRMVQHWTAFRAGKASARR